MGATELEMAMLRQAARELLVVGWRTREDVLLRMEEELPQGRARLLRATMDAVLDEEEGRLRAEQAGWPETTDCDRLLQGFEGLTRAGVLARVMVDADPGQAMDELNEERERYESLGHPMLGVAGIDGQAINLARGSGELIITASAADEAVQARVVAMVREAMHAAGLEVKTSDDSSVSVRFEWLNRCGWGAFPPATLPPPARAKAIRRPKPPAGPDVFLYFTTKATDRRSRGGLRPWSVSVRAEFKEGLAFQRDGVFAGFSAPVRAEAEVEGPAEDFPFTLGLGLLASERAWRLVDRMYPGNADYFPVTVTFDGRDLGLSYGLLRLRNRLDCIDVPRSDAVAGGELFTSFAVDPAMVPTSVGLFEARRGLLNPVIRGDLAAALDAHGLTGWSWSRTINSQ